MGSIGASASESGGELSFYGRDPIVPSVVRFGAMSAIALAAKALQIASIWRMRSGESQNIHVDVRKALRRFSPFIDGRWELLNGYAGGMYSNVDSAVAGEMYRSKDGKWFFPTNPYPGMYGRMLRFLNIPGSPESMKQAIGEWHSADLEQAAVKAGVSLAMARSVEEIMALDVYTQGLRDTPLISVERIGDAPPRPFSENPAAPLSGVRALGLGHVIAGASIGRSLALHGADVLNVWNPNDWEHDVFLNTSHVGMRSTTLLLSETGARAKFLELMSGADIFFANRRFDYLARHGLTAEEACHANPGLIHTNVLYCNAPGQPWSDRVGFDVTSGFAMGLDCLEGSYEKPEFPPIFVVNDYVVSWLATIGALQALKRRAVEGGSYKVTVSLCRATLWLISLGIFDKTFARTTAGSSDAHRYVEPDQFTVETPMGLYTGVTEMVEMSQTPGSYRFPREPRGAAKPQWLED
ncbi:CoA transferase [Paraburkholderia bryophila]|uniref:CoA transferase n=1 Tax=Paraburkholderia bryophila TaxID=420952 RepID=UPI0023497D13|nr:CoA transferase [Paraburkholderia bryophila]WCM19756.1 CoA transferase [Paraburkholderia bryophila]